MYMNHFFGGVINGEVVLKWHNVDNGEKDIKCIVGSKQDPIKCFLVEVPQKYAKLNWLYKSGYFQVNTLMDDG